MIKRSVWKFPYIYLYNINKEKHSNMYNRNCTITSSLIGKKIKLHRGNRWNKMNIEEKFLNHKIGEFFFTKILGSRVAYRKHLKLKAKKGKGKSKKKK